MTIYLFKNRNRVIFTFEPKKYNLAQAIFTFQTAQKPIGKIMTSKTSARAKIQSKLGLVQSYPRLKKANLSSQVKAVVGTHPMSCFLNAPLNQLSSTNFCAPSKCTKAQKKGKKEEKKFDIVDLFSSSSSKKAYKKLAKKFIAKKYKTPFFLEEEMQITRR